MDAFAVVLAESAWAKSFTTLDGLVDLKDGWNGYAAAPPTAGAIRSAHAFLNEMHKQLYAPTRIAASVMGGVGITRRVGSKKVYVEFYNDGTAHALFSSGRDDMRTRGVTPEPADLVQLIAEMQAYLDG